MCRKKKTARVPTAVIKITVLLFSVYRQSFINHSHTYGSPVITGLSDHIRAATTEASDWLNNHVSNVCDDTAGGPAGNTGALVVLE